MHKIISQYIEEMKEKDREVFEKKKADTLNELGLYEKEFPADPENYEVDEYDSGFYDEETETYRRFKKVPIKVSDEDYEEILKYADIKEEDDDSNSISGALKFIAISTYILGGIAGLCCIEFSFLATVLVWLSSFVFGTIVLGFSEALKLLYEIKIKMK